MNNKHNIIMNYKLRIFILLIGLGSIVPLLQAEDLLMPQFGKQEVTVSADSPLTFYDTNGTGSINSSTANNAFSTVVFTPAEEGNAIMIAFDNVDVRNDGTNYPAYLNIYDGVFDDTDLTYPTTTSGVTTTKFPVNDALLASLDGTFANLTYVSSDASGALSVCYHYKYAKTCEGWKATVSSVKVEDMAVQTAYADYAQVETEVYAGKKGVVLAGCNIQAEGLGNPDALTSLSFTLNNAEVIDPQSLKLYMGNAARTENLQPINATLTNTDGVYIFTCSATLSSGLNQFCIGTDILTTAPFDATVSLSLTALTTRKGYNTLQTAAPRILTVARMVLISKENATYKVEQPMNFYDDGGAKGNISNNFEGTVTFVPAHEGKKVQIDFSNIRIFYTSSAVGVGNEDRLQIYNGTTVSAANLLYEVKTDQLAALTLKSTAPDGALTVYMRSKTPSAAYVGSGFEAIVSEFTPQTMEVQQCAVEKMAERTLAAGETTAPLLCFNVQTINTEPALTPASFCFSTNQTYPQQAAMKVYYTGRSDIFTTSTLVGSAIVVGNEVTVFAEKEIALSEGDNYFWLACDVADTAQNETLVDAVVEKVTFDNGTTYSDITTPVGTFAIYNIVRSDCGTRSVTVYGDWAYTHTLYSEYSDKYAASNCEQVVSFLPAIEGNLVQIDYADFAVYYASTSYGTKAKYEIYNGQGTNGEKLWEVNADNYNVGPGSVRSSAADGALTVVFNPNTTASYYTEKGWHATVYQYTPRDMQVESVSVEQASTKLVKPGEKAADILNIDISTLGTLNPLVLQEITLDLGDCAADVDSVLLSHNGKEIGRVLAAPQVSIPCALVLNEYSNILSVQFNIKATATVGNEVDAALLNLKVGEQSIVPEAGNPEGERPVKNVYFLAVGDNGTVNIDATSLMFYDDGGEEADYSAGFEGWVTFLPTQENHAVELIFHNFNCAYGCSFYIYYGDKNNEAYDLGFGYYDKPSEQEVVVSKADNGALTIYFKAGGYSQMAGWEIEVRSHELMPLRVEKVETRSIAPAVQTIGAADITLLQMALQVTGDRGLVDVNEFVCTTEGPLSNLRWYATGKSDVFVATTDFTNSYSITDNGTYYFWAVADVATTAVEGDVLKLSVQSVGIDDKHFTLQEEVTASVSVVSGVHGTFLIGKSSEADYHTIQSAIDALSIGIDGAVLFLLEPGRYEEQILLPELIGVSETNTLTFRSQTGNRDDVEINWNNALTDVTGVWTFAGADWVTLESLSFTSNYTGATQASILSVRNQSEHITLRDCYIHADCFTVNTGSLNLLRLVVESGSQAFNNYFTLEQCRLDGGYTGCYLTGHYAAADPNTEGLNIVGNTFINQGSKMLYLDGFNKPVIAGNTFTNTVRVSGFYAIDNINFGELLTLSGNTITLTLEGNVGASGIYLRPNSYQDKTAVFDMYNNVINIRGNNDYACNGIYCNNNLPLLRIAYNTVVINNNAEYDAPLYLYSKPAEGSLLLNNILQSVGKGCAVRYRSATYVGNVSFAHNVLYVPENNRFAGAVAETFDAWQTVVGATETDGNKNEQVVFVNNDLLMPREVGSLLSAQPLSYVTTDIAGIPRAEQPTIGAYEYNPELTLIPVLDDGYPKATNITFNAATLVLKATSNGGAYVLLLPSSADAPDYAAVLAEGQHLTLIAGQEISLTLETLLTHTEYTAYLILTNLLGELADDYSTYTFTTDWEHHAVVIADIAAQQVPEGTAVRFVAKVTETYQEAEPYSFVWTNFAGDTLALDSVLTLTAQQTIALKVSATDAFGTRGVKGTSLQVLKEESETATFEEYLLKPETALTDDETWNDWNFNSIYSGTYAFDAYLQRDWGMLTGFALSNETATEYQNYAHQFRSAVGYAYSGDNYAVYYPVWGDEAKVRLTHSSHPEIIRGFYITNTAWVVNAICHGDGLSEGVFEQGDWLKITVTGETEGKKTNSVDYYLADYRADNAADRYYLDTWQWVDLRSLGAVDALTFTFTGTKTNLGGITTPTYFCMDDFNGAPVIDTLNLQPISQGSSTLNMAEWFAFDSDATVTYKVEDLIANHITCSLNGNVLCVNADAPDANASVVISATQCGHIRFVCVPLAVSEETGSSANAFIVTAYPNPVIDWLYITAPIAQGIVEVYNADGLCMMRQSLVSTLTKIEVGSWASGFYLVRVISHNGVCTHRILKQ
ncbi:MAG: DUF4465 domain-containing protein [Bacteroides sp.]|nr:DUF4465 domain-containing protein [Bacteroidales bacterium]MCM1069396.1 DUF4465 domain-containing protein [Prevotella sp.]MCM1353916.1 DUF4465 domain-containing protein [Bacteroides sp.]MCM1403180.1 DUF4465 domain-containing protein [Bacteroides sp.]MCM1442834.1 DUF4465 domain-containing protein [Muribaculum sp.]